MKKRTFIRKFLRMITWFSGILFGLCLLVLISFYIYRGKIYTRILTSVNENRPGELLVDNIHIAPIGFYPFLAIRLDNVTFYENKKEFRDELTSPVLELQTLYVGFKYQNLLKRDFRIGGIALENGHINLKVSNDSTLNLLKGLGTYEKSQSQESGKKTDPFGKLDLIDLFNIDIHQTNDITGDNWHINLREITNYYYELGDTVKANLNGEVKIINLFTNKKRLLSDKIFRIDLDYLWSLSSLNGIINSGTISLGQANINVNGTFYSGIPAGYDIHFFLDRKGFDTIRIEDPNTFLSESATGPGKVYVDGMVRGKTGDKIPYAKAIFQIENLVMDDPLGDSIIHGLNLSGYFSTGDSSDLSQAELVIDQMAVKVGTDEHSGSFEIRNFSKPQVSLDIDSRIEMKDFDEYFHFDFITKMDGIIEVSADVNGTLDFKNNEILDDGGTIDIRFDDLSFHIPGTGQYIDHINGNIHLEEERIDLEGISLRTGNNDLRINGSISNLLYFFSDEDSPIEVILDIQANQLVLKELFADNISPISNINDVIKDLDLNLSINTTSNELKAPGFLPDGVLRINSLSANTNYLVDMLNFTGIFSIREEKLELEETTGQLEKYILSIKDMNIRSGNNDLTINGLLTGNIDPRSPETSPVFGELNLQSDRLALSSVFSFDSILAETYKEVISDADIRISYETNLENVVSHWYLPRGEISLDHFSANFKNRADISKASGTLIVTDNVISFEALQGVYGESDLEFSAHVNNYPGFWITDSIIEIDINFSARSDMMRADDFFTYKDNFYLLGKYKGEFLENFALAANFHYINQDFFGAESLPNASIEITELQWITSYDNLFFRDFHIQLTRDGNDLGLSDFKGKIGESDFSFNAYLKNFSPFTDPKLSELSAEFSMKATNLDLNELTGIKFPKPEQPKFNPFKFIYHDLSLELDIDKLSYKDFLINNIEGKLSTERSNKIHLDKLTMETAGGNLQIMADLDTENPEDVIMSSKVVAKNIQIEKILVNFQLKDEEISPGEYFMGILSVETESEVHMDPGFKIDLAHTSGNMDFSLKDGRILDYPPIQELAKYFGDKDLANVRFTGSGKDIKADKGKVTVPRMAVNSTLGHMYFTGVYNIDAGLEYTFEVPFRLIASTAWNMLVKRTREENALEDKIQTPSKGAYVTLRLVGNETDGYQMKLGKGNRNRKSRGKR